MLPDNEWKNGYFFCNRSQSYTVNFVLRRLRWWRLNSLAIDNLIAYSFNRNLNLSRKCRWISSLYEDNISFIILDSVFFLLWLVRKSFRILSSFLPYFFFLGSISPTYYVQLLHWYFCAKKVHTLNLITKKLRAKLLYEKAARKMLVKLTPSWN